MQYRKFGKTGETVSVLGFGAMRFPCKAGKVDADEAVAMLRRSIDAGLTYIDTAYFYHDGESESIVGRALKDGYREKVHVATKMPLCLVEKPEDFERFLTTQLERLEIGAIDFYLFHALDRKEWDKVKRFGLLEKMERAKQEGKIRHIGFSFHDDYEIFQQILDEYDGWEFCQIQLNYVGVDYQAGIRGLEYAASKGLGVVIMEPLLGGKLAAPPRGVQAALDDEKTPVEWALDFLWNRPEVTLLLSGMSTMQQAEDNLLYADRARVGMLNDGQLAMLARAKTAYDTIALVPCTKCRYCMPCPFGVEIPRVFEGYNMTVSQGMDAAAAFYAEIEGKADQCRACRKCEKVCPQHIEISAVLAEACAAFAGNS